MVDCVVSDSVVATMVDSMMLSTGKCDQGRKNEAPHVDCLKV